jgi:protein dithiol oxidoreductase (disulfide-forming)
MLSLRAVFILLCFLVLTACNKPEPAQEVIEIHAGKDYQIISSSEIIPVAEAKSRVHVIEFFNYACPGCYRLEPDLEAWLAKQPNYIVFERIPVIFNPSWASLARMYYIAKMLGVDEKTSSDIFKAIHEEHKDLTNLQAQREFFKTHGVSEQDFDGIANFSSGVNAQLLRGETLMRNYKVNVAPTIVIDGRFKTDPSMAQGDVKRFFLVLDRLIEKVRKGEN